MSTVIAAVDSSAASRPVVAMACAVAPVLGATVEAVHVGEEAGGVTARACCDAAGVPFRVIRGDPLPALLELVARDDVQVVVMGARGRPIRTRPLGHLGLLVADRIDKPVIVVPPEATPPARLHRVVIALEGVPGRAKALKRAIALSEASGLACIAVHVDDEESIPMFDDQAQHETDAYATEFLLRYAPGLAVDHLELRIGEPVEEVLAAARGFGAELLAIGWPQSDDRTRGRVARAILDRATMPVLLVALA